MTDTRTYTPKEVAERTGKGIATVYRHLRSQKLPAEKFGGEWVITREDLRDWLPEALFERHFGEGPEEDQNWE
jgi:excisionase family DNA binding protein